jgi:hypothetical protein
VRTGAELNEFEAQALRNYPFLLVMFTTVALVVIDRRWLRGIADWDWFWISGVLMFVVAYPLSLRVPVAVGTSLRQVALAGRLHRPDRLAASLTALHRRAGRWALTAALVLAALVLAAWLVVLAQRWTDGRSDAWIGGAVIETLCAGLAGRLLGRTLCYSGAGGRLRRDGMGLTAGTPGARHDLIRRLGAFWTSLVDLPLLLTTYLATWLVLITVAGPEGRYWDWRYPYLFFVPAFLGLVILIGARALSTVRAVAALGSGGRLVVDLLSSRPVAGRLLVVVLIVAAIAFAV